MNSAIVTTTFVTLLFAQGSLTGLPGPSSKESIELRTTLEGPVYHYSVDGTFVDALIEVAGRFKVPMGITWVRQPLEPKPIHLSWGEATVEKVVREIAHAEPGYEIGIRNAVV